MGVIQQQALKTSVLTFMGIGLGMLSRFMMPFVLEKGQIAALNMIDSVTLMIGSFSTIGFAQVAVRFYSIFKKEGDESNNAAFLTLTFFYSLFGVALGLVVFYVFDDLILGDEVKSATVRSVAYLIFPVLAFRILFMNNDVYLRMISKSVTGVFWEGFILKLLVLIGVVLVAINALEFVTFSWLYALALAVPGLAVSIIVFKGFKGLQKGFFKKKHRKELITLSAFGLIGIASGSLIKTVDVIMVNRMLGEDQLGVYAVLFLGGIIVSIPARGIRRAAISVLSQAWAKNDMQNIASTYSKSALNLLIVGFYLLIIGWACIDEVLYYLPDYQSGVFVFLFIGIAQLIDMMTGVNAEVISTSEKYKVNTYFNIALIGLTIISNYYFIQFWGLPGAAIASALSLFLVNISRWYYLKIVYGLQPFQANFFKALILGILFLVGVSFIELPIHPLLSAVIQFILISLLYWVIVIKLEWSEDISLWIKKIRTKYGF